LTSDVTIEYQESVRISEEIEALRAITEQVNAQSDTLQIVTVGEHPRQPFRPKIRVKKNVD